MKLTLHMYVAQPRKGHFEVSIPWVAALAEPQRGPSPAQLKEELMFRALELMHGEFSPEEVDRLIPLERPYLTSIYLDVRRKVDVDRPEVQMNATTHVVVGSWPDDSITRLWIPKVPGTCVALNRVDDMYAALNSWAKEWAETNAAEDLERLQCSYVGQIESFEIDLGWPTADAVAAPPSGRLKRPATLQEVATNLSHRAEDETLGRAFGRDRLVDELVEALMSPRPQNICLVGPPGVGKTALVHEAARRTFALAAAYQERRDIWQTSGDRIIAGMSIIGQWEQRTEAICRELAERQDILFVEDLLSLVRSGRTSHGDSNVARFIEPYLEQDRFSVIAEATEETWVWARSDAPGFVDKFRRIQVPELSYRETLGVVSDLIREIEGTHRVRFTADGVETLLHLARRFFRQEAFPGKAVRLVRQCQHDAARVEELADEEWVRVDPERVAGVVRRQTGLPPTILRPGLGRSLDEVHATFSGRVFGQPRAVDVVSRLVVAIEQGLSDPQRPLAALLLVGPSGVGKTETAKALAHDLFGNDDRMVRFDMSEFSGPAALSRLIGTPRQPDGELTSKVRLQPFCVLLFDEVEKAHPIVLDLLLQLLGDGRLTDAAGRTVDFRNAIVVMTSNLGASSEDRWLGFAEQTRSDRELHYRRAAEEFFRPELFNRIDHVVPYSPLGPVALRRIARRTLQNLLERRGLRQAQVMVDVDEGLIDYLVKRSIDPRYGARTLANRVEQLLVAPLAQQLTSWRGSDSLTRVIMKPSEDGVDLSLHTIARASRVAEAAEPSKVATEQEAILRELSALTQQTEELSSDGRRDVIVGDYDRLLGKINELGSTNADARMLADDLRRHETVLDRLGRLERRVAGLQDPRGTGQFLYSAQTDDRERKGKAHRWSKIAAELRTEVRWIECQMEALASDEVRGMTLVVAGLSGPYSELLMRWSSWLAALDRGFGLEGFWAHRTVDGGWRAGDPIESATAFAISSLAPGVRELFTELRGYTWSPRPPSHGQHALVLNRGLDGGAHDINQLIDRLSSTLTPDTEHYVEFIESEGQLEDVRHGRKYAIPEDRAHNLFEFMVEVSLNRMTAVSDEFDLVTEVSEALEEDSDG